MNIWSYFLPFSLIFPPLLSLKKSREHGFFIFSSLFPPLPLLNETREQIGKLKSVSYTEEV
ncbi:hypothetical protein Hanom_Chr02g00153521 [Helianthus anomalus]